MTELKKNQQGSKGAVLVVGAGIAGITASLYLAKAGRRVILIEKSPSLGGLMPQLDRTFPTDNCDFCTVASQLAQEKDKLPLDIMLKTELISLQGVAGAFECELLIKANPIDNQKCTACGVCVSACPREAISLVPGFDQRSSTCIRYPHSIPQAYVINTDLCDQCGQCIPVCIPGAIDLTKKDEKQRVDVASVILALGAEIIDVKELQYYGYGISPNIVTGLELERILSASGPTGGELLRPSDGKRPERIAWIQCVGSRNDKIGQGYCSSICCMYALKEISIVKERVSPDIETSVFFMDMRTCGKGYETYYQRVKNELGVRFVRARPHTIMEAKDSGNLIVQYMEDHDQKEEEFDLVVLSTGLKPSESAVELARKLGLQLNQYSFIRSDPLVQVETSREGIYACGMIEEPKDIPETVVQAGAAASKAALHLPSTTATPSLTSPTDDIVEEDIRTGIFVCACGDEIAGRIDLARLMDRVSELPSVELVREQEFSCHNVGLEEIEREIKERRLNRVVVAACSPRSYEILFQEVAEKAGLNRHLVSVVNIREQDAWVHSEDKEMATKKAEILVRMATGALRRKKPLTEYRKASIPAALVLGGGVAGMTAAVELSKLGHSVFLVEKTGSLGGVSRSIHKTLNGGDVQALIQHLEEMVEKEPNIELITQAEVVGFSGEEGSFSTELRIGPDGESRTIEHGVVILATGADPYRPKEYMYGESPLVIDQLELEAQIHDRPQEVKDWDNVVMIQCVGSRNDEHPNCGRVCCQTAINNALKLKELNPDMGVLVLYRDIRTYGFQEDYYRLAREKGVIFERYDPDDPPKVEKESNNRVKVKFKDLILNRDMEAGVNALVLSTSLVASPDTRVLSRLMGLDLTEDGFFKESHIKLEPVVLTRPGFFVCGSAHYPKTIAESISQALAAAGKAHEVLSRRALRANDVFAVVEREKCAVCLTCVRVCPYDVPFINGQGYSQIDPLKCRGCGLCAAECPGKAIQLLNCEDDQILAQNNALVEVAMFD
nr:CoB--CoM heterodisulfide reductase iron-sulfur subunit A family protein [Desulfobacterales bacterium]